MLLRHFGCASNWVKDAMPYFLFGSKPASRLFLGNEGRIQELGRCELKDHAAGTPILTGS